MATRARKQTPPTPYFFRADVGRDSPKNTAKAIFQNPYSQGGI